MKTCTRCGEGKPEAEFYLRKSRGTRDSTCRTCQSQRAQAWQAANPERAKAARDRYAKNHQAEIAAQKRQYFDDPVNKAAAVQRSAAWRKANPDKAKALRATYREKHREELRQKDLARYHNLMAEDPERVRAQRRDWAKTPTGRACYRSAQHARRGAPLTKEARQWWASLVDPKCHYCGEPAIEIDHVIPISKGGTGDLSNLVPACRYCNARKNDLDLDEFLEVLMSDTNLMAVA